MQKEVKNIVILGTGNVASHLITALSDTGKNIIQVFGRNEDSVKEIGDHISFSFISDPQEIRGDADLYLVVLRDEAIISTLDRMPRNDKLIAHTSGSLPISILEKYSDNTGVFYPLQTFTKGDIIPYHDIPFCIEANTKENEQLLVNLAKQISNDVRIINSNERKILHLAAVFACNFPNYLYTIAEKILQRHGIAFDVLIPLIERTAGKIRSAMPSEVQTGPAQRGDQETIEKHIKLLEDEPDYKEIYKLLSEAIINENE